MDDLITKTELARRKGKSDEFISGLPLPVYPVKKRLYVRESDYEATLEMIKQEPVWASTKSKGRRTTNSTSPSKVLGIEEARKQIREQMRKPSTH